ISNGFNYTDDSSTSSTVSPTYISKYNLTINTTDGTFYDPCRDKGLICYSELLLEAVKIIEFDNTKNNINENEKSSTVTSSSTTQYFDYANPCDQILDKLEEK
ncbi:unnamed protein product, partial [Meganyctiphanes norvegica]